MIPAPVTEQPQIRKDTAERMAAAVRPAAGATWAAAEVMHLAGVHAALPLGGATALAAVLAWGAAGRRDDVPASLPWWIAAAGGWFTTAAALGPLDWWPAPVLSIAWAAFAFAASRAAHGHDAVRDAREWREEREKWLVARREWGLHGSHLDDFERTRLGELYTVNIKGTGKRRSQLLGSALAEVIALAENLDESRVRVMRHGPSRYIRISIRRVNPWKDPILHPLVTADHEIELPERRSILQPAAVGQDPETGELLTVPLYTQAGANRVSITASSGGGKGVFEDNLFEHVSSCPDAVAVHLNLSMKGHEDEGSWGPACWLTAYGEEQKSRAAKVLEIVTAVLEWRSKNFKRGSYRPSPEHPAIIIFHDESDAAAAFLREAIKAVVTKGRSHGAAYVHMGQRNIRGYVDPTVRSQDNVRCTGMVQNSNEAGKAGSGQGPDMSTYGEGKPGVWKIELLGGGMQLGRTWMFAPAEYGHAREVERIAQDRAHEQAAEFDETCLESLGDLYGALRASEVYERWCRAGNPDGRPGDEPEVQDQPDGPVHAGDPVVPRQEPAAAPAATGQAAATAVAEEDPFDKWLEMNVADDPESDTRMAGIREKLSRTRQALEEAAPGPLPGTQEQRAAYIGQRWQQEAAKIPLEVRPQLMEMLGAGTTAPAVSEALGVPKSKAQVWLSALRSVEVAYVDGQKRGAKWRLAPPPGDGDTP